MKRVFLCVIDSLGVGAAPDAPAFGDEGSCTLCSVLKTGVSLPHLTAAGLCDLVGHPSPNSPTAAVARLLPLSAAKDTTAGHWEMAGLVTKNPFPTYSPRGLDEKIMKALTQLVGGPVLGEGKPWSGTEVIARLGEEHCRSGAPIVYTSADSVIQIAAHEETFGLQKLLGLCARVRTEIADPLRIGRVIARPFVGTPGAYTRTANRRDFSLQPPSPTMLDLLALQGHGVYAVGKIEDIFAGRGISRSVHTHSNREGMELMLEAMHSASESLTFVNLVDFDSTYGHRRDARGYANALAELDAFVPRLIQALGKDDLLILTADHGCDPSFRGTDHTREAVGCLVFGSKIPVGYAGTFSGFQTVAACVMAHLGLNHPFGCRDLAHSLGL